MEENSRLRYQDCSTNNVCDDGEQEKRRYDGSKLQLRVSGSMRSPVNCSKWNYTHNLIFRIILQAFLRAPFLLAFGTLADIVKAFNSSVFNYNYLRKHISGRFSVEFATTRSTHLKRNVLALNNSDSLTVPH